MDKYLGSLIKETALLAFDETELLSQQEFLEEDRQRAKQGIPYSTRLYIEQLEQVGRSACQLWERVLTTINTNPHACLEDVRYDFLQSLNHFYEAYEQVGFLLPDAHTDDD